MSDQKHPDFERSEDYSDEEFYDFGYDDEYADDEYAEGDYAPYPDEEEQNPPVTEFDRRARALMGGEGGREGAKSPQKRDARRERPTLRELLARPENPKKAERNARREEKLSEALAAEEREFGEEGRDYMPIRFRREYRVGCLGGIMYATFVICLSIVLACVLWMSASDVLALNKPLQTAEVTLPESIFSDKLVDVKDENGKVTGKKMVRSADIDAVSAILKSNGLISYRGLFKLYASFSHADQKLDPGTYTLSTAFDYRALVTKMQVGSDSQIQTLVTFPEGFTLEQIFARLEENGICEAEKLREAAANYDYSYSFLEGIEMGDPLRLEGFLFPDTYYFYQGMQASGALNKFLSNFRNKLTAEMIQLVQYRQMSYREAVTLASIIEKEAANDNERYLISSVIYNRLAKNMPLQMDSTVLYHCGDDSLTMPTGTMIRDESNPYNTYVHRGLPPGPICNPGMASIRAAVNPATTEYLFFALDEETGEHRFFIYQKEFEAFLKTQSYYETPD